MLNLGLMAEPFNWFVVAFAAGVGLLLFTLIHPMTTPQ